MNNESTNNEIAVNSDKTTEFAGEKIKMPETIKVHFSKFDATARERIMAVLILPLAYIYFSYACESDLTARVLLTVFTVLFIAFGEAMYFKRKRSSESFIFLGLTVTAAVSYCFNIGMVWESGWKVLFIHLFAVYWVLCRSNRLAENETSHLFFWDGLNAFAIMPFSNFPLCPETIATIFKGVKEKDRKRIFIICGSIISGIILFLCAMAFLRDSDANFEAMMSIFDIDFNFEIFWRCIFSVIIAFYLYGLFGGCFRLEREKMDRHTEEINSVVAKLNRVPSAVWITFIALFSVFYIIYFALQGSYLLDAFSMILPEKYTFSEYARKGFGDMCAVMIINFFLLWLSSRTSEAKIFILKVFNTILICESIVFALIAFLKLLMYIKAYGFTPLRLQSVWLVLVLTYACVCILISMYTHRKTAKIWFIGSASALGVLTLI